MNRLCASDAALLLFLRVTASVLVLLARGLPKAIHYASRLDAIEDPPHFKSRTARPKRRVRIEPCHI